jgi:hypothetical protein
MTELQLGSQKKKQHDVDQESLVHLRSHGIKCNGWLDSTAATQERLSSPKTAQIPRLHVLAHFMDENPQYIGYYNPWGNYTPHKSSTLTINYLPIC